MTSELLNDDIALQFSDVENTELNTTASSIKNNDIITHSSFGRRIVDISLYFSTNSRCRSTQDFRLFL